MQFLGGQCNLSNTTQTIPCFDFGNGPPTASGSRAYIVVTHNTSTYFSGWVHVNETYVIKSSSGGGGLIGGSMSIVIYKSAQLTPGNVLQSLIFVGNCVDQPLLIQERFGASQVKGFLVNGSSTQAIQTLQLNLTVSVAATSVSVAATSVTLRTLQTQSNAAGNLNLTQTVSGRTVVPGGHESVGFDIQIDATVPKTYNFVSTVTGVSNTTRGQSTCTNVSDYSFTVK
jgi:hypothetical protein